MIKISDETENVQYRNDDRQCAKFTCFHRTHYLIITLSIICLAWLVGNSILLNFTIICMVPDPDNQGTCKNCSPSTNGSFDGMHKKSASELYEYTTNQKNLLFSAVAIGSLLGTYPVIVMSTRLSIRKHLFIYGLISGISTLLIPLGASISFWFLFLLRILQGYALAINFSMIGCIANNWSPAQYHGMYTAWISCNLQLGPMFTMPTAGMFCLSHFGWQGSFYFQGSLTIISFIIFYFTFKDTPRIHRFVSSQELHKLEGGRTRINPKKIAPVPFKDVFKTRAVWIIWIASGGATWGYQIFLQYGPIYLNKVMNYDIANASIVAALANFVTCIIKILAGPLSDSDKCFGPTNRVKLFTCISQGVMMFSFVILAIIPKTEIMAGIIAFIAAVSFSGVMWVGAGRSAALVAKQHAHFLFTVTSFLNSLSMLILPLFVGIIAPDHTPQQWSQMLIITCCILLMTTALFVLFGKGEAAWWTNLDFNHPAIFSTKYVKNIDGIIASN